MGIYINGPHLGVMKTAQFLKWAEAGEIEKITKKQALMHHAGNDEKFVAVVVENGWMDAAGLAYDDRERDMFLANPHDTRPMTCFLVTAAWVKTKDADAGEALQKAYEAHGV